MTDLFLQQVELGGDLLCRRGATPYYSFNLANLMTPDVRTEDHIEKKIMAKLKDTLTALQNGSGRTIAKFYIGKTFVTRKRGFIFDPDDNNTWKKDGIGSRWGNHKKECYGEDGMVVLCAITKDTVPFGATCMHQEDFTLDMKQRLIRHYREDARLVNTTEDPGLLANRDIAYAIYMAFAYAEEDEETEEEED